MYKLFLIKSAIYCNVQSSSGYHSISKDKRTTKYSDNSILQARQYCEQND